MKKCNHIKRQVVASQRYEGPNQAITVVCLKCGIPIYSYKINSDDLEFQTPENE